MSVAQADSLVPLEWIEKTAAMKVVGVRKQDRWRPHYFISAVDPHGEPHELLLRTSRPHGKDRVHSRFTGAHEAMILEALQKTDVRCSKYYGYHEPTETILMSRLSGTASIHRLTDPGRQAELLLEFFENVAILHKANLKDIGLEGRILIPETDEDIALELFSLVEQLVVTPGALKRPDPLARAALIWLRNNVPSPVRGVSLLQGDCGPTNFMFDENGITGLTDWELAHPGDPFLDLGFCRFRNMLYPSGDLNPGLHRYADLTGFELDLDAIRYHTVVSLVFAICAIIDFAQDPRLSPQMGIQTISWDLRERLLACEEMLDVMGIPLPVVEPPMQAEDAMLPDLLLDRIVNRHFPEAPDDIRAALSETVAVAEAVRRQAWIGRASRSGELDDLAEALRKRPASYLEGLKDLETLAVTGGEDGIRRTVIACYKMTIRQYFYLEPLIKTDTWDDDPSARRTVLRSEPDWDLVRHPYVRMLAPLA